MSNKKGKPKQERQQQQSTDLGEQEQQNQSPRENLTRPSSKVQLGRNRSNQQFDPENPSIVRSEN
ncbi:MAG TPA: hypothetical protein VK642_14880 [Burkholderiales bacterium]|nr:hypothetical protein [Burkholderiales bacterium]